MIPPLHESDLFLGQPIQLVHQPDNLLVGGLDLALVQLLAGGDGGGGQLLVEVQHMLHQRDDLVLEPPVGCNELSGEFWLSATPSPHESLSGLTAEFSVHQIGDGWICQREAQPRVPSPVG